MPAGHEFILGEFPRTLDERFRLSLPPELLAALAIQDGEELILAKERPGCLSVWRAADWKVKLDQAIELVQAKMRAGKLEGRIGQVQLWGRLISTRHRVIQLAGRGRLLVPEGFREFLRVEAGGELMVVGAAVCVELWSPAVWLAHLEQRMPRFRRLMDRLSN